MESLNIFFTFSEAGNLLSAVSFALQKDVAAIRAMLFVCKSQFFFTAKIGKL